MLKPVSIEGWAVIVCMGDRDLRGQGMGSLDNFIGAIITGFSSMAMGITRDPVVQWGADMGRYPDPATFSDSVTQMLKSASGMNKKIDVVFVIIPKKGALCLDSRIFRSLVVVSQTISHGLLSSTSLCWARAHVCLSM
jgi:hypothetical protein